MEPTPSLSVRSGSTTAEVVSPLDLALADQRAFDAWYEAMLPNVYGYLLHRCGRNAGTAEELTQETFVEAVRSRQTFRVTDTRPWLIGIARHRLLDHLRRESRRERTFLRIFARERPSVIWIGSDEPDADLADALARVPAAQRAALILRYVDDLPVREVARLLSRNEGAVESLLSRGRERLRREYEVVAR
jgi:RNA polymerase sigma-70 factor, ECF subfamily